MKSCIVKSLLMLLLLITVLGCGKPGSNLVGSWKSEKTADIMEFHKNNTGVIHLGHPDKYPPNIEFKWTMLNKNQFKLEMRLPGVAAVPPGNGRIEGKNTMVFEDDVFKKLTE